MLEIVLFVIFAVVSVFGGLAVVFARNPVYGAMGLMLTLFSLAVFYVVHTAHLVAAVQVIVYAGAVMTLFLFVIMLIGVDKEEDTSEKLPWQRQWVAGLGLLLLVVGLVVAFQGAFHWVRGAPALAQPNGTIQRIGEELFSTWILPFEATSLLLIIAAAGAVALAYFGPRRRGGDSVDDREEV